MAFLLLLHQKMRLQRRQNELTMKQMRITSQEGRMKNKISKREKYFSKLEQQLERQAKCYQNSMTMWINNQFGMGNTGFNMNPYASNGTAQAMIQNMSRDQMQQILGDKFNISENDAVYDAIRKGCVQVAQQDIKDSEGNVKIHQGSLYNPFDGTEIQGLSAEDAQKAGAAYQYLQQAANMSITKAQSDANNMKMAYENNVSIWLEAQKEQLDMQREWEMDMLNDQQSDIELEKNSNDAEIEMVKSQLQALEQQLPKAIQDSAPKFGLG